MYDVISCKKLYSSVGYIVFKYQDKARIRREYDCKGSLSNIESLLEIMNNLSAYRAFFPCP